MQKIPKYSVVTQPLPGLAAHKHMHFNKSCFEKCSERQIRPTHTSTCSGTVLGCHEAVVRTLSFVSPEVVEETFFFFSSGEWEADCDTSSPLDTPGVKRAKTTM